MLTEGLYKFSELSRLIQESNEFKPVIGKNVIKDDAKNNVEAVDDIMKDTGKMKGESVEESKKTNPEDAKDYNKTTLDVNFTTKPSKEYEERVKAQVHGFPSKDNEENSKIEKENESLDFEGNKEFYKNQSEKHKEVSDKETDPALAPPRTRVPVSPRQRRGHPRTPAPGLHWASIPSLGWPGSDRPPRPLAPWAASAPPWNTSFPARASLSCS